MIKEKNRKWSFLMLATVILMGILSVMAVKMLKNSNSEALKSSKIEFFGMNTYITFTAYGTNAEKALQEAEEKMSELEQVWSVTEEGSEIYRVNHSNGEPVTVSEQTAEVIDYAISMAKDTDGALEPTIYPILRAWGFTTGENQVPENTKIQELINQIGYKKISLTGNQIRLQQGTELDLGAVGKGYAGDLVIEVLKEQGITSALLDIGGNIQAIGTRPDGTDWQLGIRNPYGEGTLGTLFVADKAVVTSGNYERYFVGEDGKEYGHIIDPETGYPVENDLAAMTIIAEEGKQGDALSTAMYVKGLEGAISYWKAHQDFEMIAVTDKGEIYLTEEIADDFTLSNTFGNLEIHVIKK